MKQKIKIGVLGCANIAVKSVIPAILSSNLYELVAVCSRTKEKAEKLANLFQCEAIEGYENIINRKDIEALYIPLPTGLHKEWVLKSLQSNKHVLVEKSLAMNYSEAKEMVHAAQSRQLLIMENFMFQYHNQHQLVKKLISEGKIGELRCFRSSFGFPPLDKNNFRYNQQLGGGALLDAGAYTLKATQLFLGNKLTVKAAILNCLNHEVDVYGGAFLVNPQGMFSEIAFGFDNFYQCNYELWGSKGKIIAHKSFTPAPLHQPLITLEQQDYKEEYFADAENHFVSILNEFYSTVEQGNFQPKYEEILLQSQLIDEVQQKAK